MSPPPDKPSTSSAPGPPAPPAPAPAPAPVSAALAAGDAPPSASFDPFASTASLPLLVRLPDGERHQVDVPPNASIKDLKSAIAGMVDDGPNTSQAPWDLDFGGSILDDKHTLQHYNIPDAYDHANGLLKTISDSGYVDPDKKVEALDKAVAVVHGISRGEHDMEKLISGVFDEPDQNEPVSPSAQPSLRSIRRSRRSRIPSLNFANLPPPFPLPGQKSAKPLMPSAPPTPSQLLRRLSCSRPDLYDPSAVPDDDDAAIPPVSPRMPPKAAQIRKDAAAPPVSSITVSASQPAAHAPPPPTVTVSTAANPAPGDTASSKHPPPAIATTQPPPPEQPSKPQAPLQQPATSQQQLQQQHAPPPPQQQKQPQSQQPPASQPQEAAGAAPNGADADRGNTWFTDVISSFGNRAQNAEKTNESESDDDNDVVGDSEDDANALSTAAPSRDSSLPPAVKSEAALPTGSAAGAAGGASDPGTTVAPAKLSANVGVITATQGSDDTGAPAGTKSEPTPVAREGSPNGTIRSGATSTMSVSSAPSATGGTAAGAMGATSAPMGKGGAAAGSQAGGQVIGLTPDTGNTVVGPDGKVRKKRGRKRKNPHLSEEERKAQRQAQNRESAKLSRIRRKNMTIEYEKRVNTLEGENENLRDTVAALTDRLEMLQNLLTISVQKRSSVPPGALPNLAAATQQHVEAQLAGVAGNAQPAGPIAAARQLNAAQITPPVGLPGIGPPVPLGAGGLLGAQQGQGAFAPPMGNGRGPAAPLAVPSAGQGSSALPNGNVNMNFKN